MPVRSKKIPLPSQHTHYNLARCSDMAGFRTRQRPSHRQEAELVLATATRWYDACADLAPEGGRIVLLDGVRWLEKLKGYQGLRKREMRARGREGNDFRLHVVPSSHCSVSLVADGLMTVSVPVRRKHERVKVVAICGLALMALTLLA